MIFGFKIVLLVLYVACITDAVRSTSRNASIASTTKRPFRPRLRWPGSRVLHGTTTTTTTTKKPTTVATSAPTSVDSLETTTLTEVTEQVSEFINSTKEIPRLQTTTDPSSEPSQSVQPTVSHENATSVNETRTDVAHHQGTISAQDESNIALGSWNSSDETETVPSIFTEALFNLSLPEDAQWASGRVIEHFQQRQSKSKPQKSSRGKNATVITSSTINPDSFGEDYRFKPAENSPGERVVIYSTESTESNSQDRTTAVNPASEVPSGGTYVYVVAIVGVIPTVGMLVCFAKHVFSRPEKSKEVSKVTNYCGVDFPVAEPRREIRETDQSGKVLQNNTFQTVYACAQYASSNVKSSWKRMQLEYPRENLELTEVLGEGNFGIVWKAEATDIDEPRHCQIVAVKTVKETASYKERHELLRELRIMQLFDDHPNVVRLLGCCTETEPYLLIMEFVKKGKLQSFLRDHRSKRKYYNSTADGLSSRDLTAFAYQIANGMEYISRIGVIHRDLAARNILVDHNNVCKVADFGLSRTTEDGDNGLYEQKTKGALPIRWMAPESLYLSIFTTKSDVWAFGILLWEIVTLGSTPYPGMGAREVMYHVQKGNTMECPDHCHPDLYSVMCACWAADSNGRPTFKDLRETLGSRLEFQAGYVDLDHFPESSFYNLYQSPGERV